MRKIFLLACLALSQVLHAQKVDSVNIGGTFYYVYPYPKEVYPSTMLLQSIRAKEMEAVSTLNGDAWFIMYSSYGINSLVKPDKAQIRLIRKNAEHFYSTLYDTETDMIPSLDKLPNGRYVQYFDEYVRFDEKDQAVIERRKVAGFFSLKDNLPHGDALWLSMTGDTAKYGKFSNGEKEGVWTSAAFGLENLYLYSKASIAAYLTSKPAYSISKYAYINGVRNGLYESYEGSRLLEKGHYKDGEPAGEWFIYAPGSVQRGTEWIDTSYLVKHYTLAEAPPVSHKPYIRNSFYDGDWPSKYYTFPDYFDPIMFTSFWKMNLEKEDLDLPEEELNSYEGGQYDYSNDYAMEADFELGGLWVGDKYLPRGKIFDSLGIVNTYTGVYEEFWTNGQLKMRLNFVNGDLVSEDTIFWDNGKPANVVVYDPVKKEYENRLMDYEGILYEVAVYDSLGDFKEQTLDPLYRDKHIPIEGLDAQLVENYIFTGEDYSSSSMWTVFEYDRSDTLKHSDLHGNILISKNWYGDTTTMLMTTYNADEHIVTAEARSLNGTTLYKSVSEYDETFDKVRGSVSYYLKDLEMYKTFNGSYTAYIPYSESDSFPAVRTLSPYLYEMTEDNTLKYKHEPFNGKISVKLQAKTASFSVKPHQIDLNLTYSSKFLKALKKDYDNYKITGKAKYKDALAVAMIFDKGYADDLLTMFPELTFMMTGNNNNYPTDVMQATYERIEGAFLNGKPHGTWRTYDDKGKIMIECRYIDGSFDGRIKMYNYAKPQPKKKKSKEEEILFEYNYAPASPFDSLPSKPVYYLSTDIGVKHGILEGSYVTYNWQGKIKSKVNYVAGQPEGPASEHNAIASTYMNFENGAMDGIVRTYLHLPKKDSILLYELNFQNGSLQGESRSYHTNGKLSKRGFFLDGMPIDDYEGYDSLGNRFHYVKFQYSFPVEEKIWEANELSVRYLFDWRDSIYFRPDDLTQTTTVDNLLYQYGLMGSAYERPYYGRPSLVEKTGIDYHMTKYFPNDTISRDGAISAGKKTGCWKFFSYEGEKLYEVEYFDTVLKLNDSIQFRSKGILYDYDAKGNLLSKSYIIEKFEKYDCSHTDHYEIRQFYTFWQAHDSLHRINGYVKNYYDNGVLQSEGNMKNGLPTGLWKYYDPFGKLNHVGEYKMGKRFGRWLSGDLSKSKYLGDICMNPNLPNLEEQMKYQEKLLDIYVRYFKNGKLLGSEYYGLNLNRYEDGTEEEFIPEDK